MSDRQDQEEELYRHLNEALGAIPKNPGQTVPQERQKADLPPGLVEEAARMIFDFWEREAERAGHRQAIPWERLSPRFQIAWVEITNVAIQMAIKIVLTEAHRYLDSSNGDMGAAFSRALRRYAEQVLNLKIQN